MPQIYITIFFYYNAYFLNRICSHWGISYKCTYDVFRRLELICVSIFFFYYNPAQEALKVNNFYQGLCYIWECCVEGFLREARSGSSGKEKIYEVVNLESVSRGVTECRWVERVRLERSTDFPYLASPNPARHAAGDQTHPTSRNWCDL